jgi:hypothetical protein
LREEETAEADDEGAQEVEREVERVAELIRAATTHGDTDFQEVLHT